MIDAVFELLREGRASFDVDEVAARAGVSVSSVFRYFDGLDDLHAQAIARHFEQFDPLFEVHAVSDGSTRDRVEALVDARLRLYEAIAPVARVARLRAATEPAIAEALQAARRRFAVQVAEHLAADLGTGTDARDRAALADALTSFEAWDLLRTSHGRGRPTIRRAWLAGVERLLT